MSSHIRITPSILNADFSQLDAEIAKIASVSDFIHLDVMDDVFVPNFTFSFEEAVLKEAEAGAKTADLPRRHGVSEATIYNC